MRKSVADYPENWPEISREVKETAGWRCVRCDHPHDPETGYALTVHHLDLDPSNNEWWNIPALCQRCHLHIQGKVIMERGWFLDHSTWFRPYVAGYYSHLLGYPTDRDWVLSHLERLLNYGKGLNYD